MYFPKNYFGAVFPERYFPLDVVILPPIEPPLVIGGGGWTVHRGRSPIEVVMNLASGKNDDDELMLVIKAFLDAEG